MKTTCKNCDILEKEIAAKLEQIDKQAKKIDALIDLVADVARCAAEQTWADRFTAMEN